MTSTRVVVTGLGATSPVGGDVKTTWDALLAGTSGVRHLDRRLGRADAGQDRRPRGRRAVRGPRAGQGAPARPLQPVRHGRRRPGLGRRRPGGLRPRARAARRVAGLRHRWRDHAARQLRRAAREGSASRLAPRRTHAHAQRPGGQRQPQVRRPRGRPRPDLGLRLRQRGDRDGDRPDPPRPRRRRCWPAAPRPRSTRCRWRRSPT